MKTAIRKLLCAAAMIAAFSAFAMPAFAGDCVSDFTVNERESGRIDYTAVASLPGKDLAQAHKLSQEVVAQAGWEVYETLPEMSMAFARKSPLPAGTKPGELTFTAAASTRGLVLVFVYANPPGVSSAEQLVKKHFCSLASALRSRLK